MISCKFEKRNISFKKITWFINKIDMSRYILTCGKWNIIWAICFSFSNNKTPKTPIEKKKIASSGSGSSGQKANASVSVSVVIKYFSILHLSGSVCTVIGSLAVCIVKYRPLDFMVYLLGNAPYKNV